MNKVVRRHYPASKLPEDLQAELDGVRSVRLTVEPISEAPRSLKDVIDRARRLRKEGVIEPVTTEDAVARIRTLRDEWDS